MNSRGKLYRTISSPYPMFLFPSPSAIVFLLHFAQSPPSCCLTTTTQPNPACIEMCSKKCHLVRAAATPEPAVNIFQVCRVLQFTVTTEQLTGPCSPYRIEHSGTLI